MILMEEDIGMKMYKEDFRVEEIKGNEKIANVRSVEFENLLLLYNSRRNMNKGKIVNM